MVRVLVTGGAGFIGSHICEYWQAQESCTEIVVLDDFTSGFEKNLNGFTKVKLIRGSICDREAVRTAVAGIDFVFHEAALISVAESMDKPIDYVNVCVVGTLIVLEEAAAAGVKRLVFASSAACYGDDPRIPKVEWMTEDCKSPYAIAKYDGEFYCKLFTRTGRLDTVVLRYFNVFGPRQNPFSAYAAVVPIFIRRALTNEPLTIYGDGEQTRDFVYVKDIARANAYVCTAPEVVPGNVYNVGYGQITSIRDLAVAVKKGLNSSSEIVYLDARPGDVKHSTAAVTKLTLAGFKPEFELQAAMADTINYFKKEQEEKQKEQQQQ